MKTCLWTEDEARAKRIGGSDGEMVGATGDEIDMLCGRCNGSGIDPEWEAKCCGNCEWECGGTGCTGPEPEQVPCSDCGGYKEMPDMENRESSNIEPTTLPC